MRLQLKNCLLATNVKILDVCGAALAAYLDRR